MKPGLLSCAFVLLAACGCPCPRPTTPVEKPKQQDTVMAMKVVVPNYFSPLEKNLIEEATYEWTSSLNGAMTVEFVKNSNEAVVRIANDMRANPDWAEEKMDLDAFNTRIWSKDIGCTDELVFVSQTKSDPSMANRKGWLGWTRVTCHIKYIVLVTDELDSPTKFINTAAHELGHAIGLDHTLIRGLTIMYPYTGDTVTCITPSDRGNFCRIWGCDFSRTRNPLNCEEKK